eukprot:m.64316 g.64316  ORF g.64316 m.64316 type:complete len:191 (+) comp23413_c0_seq1:157-729(+)
MTRSNMMFLQMIAVLGCLVQLCDSSETSSTSSTSSSTSTVAITMDVNNIKSANQTQTVETTKTHSSNSVGLTSNEAETAFIIMGCVLVVSLVAVSIFFARKSPSSYNMNNMKTHISFSSDPSVVRAKPFFDAIKGLDTASVSDLSDTLGSEMLERNQSRISMALPRSDGGVELARVVSLQLGDYPLVVDA